MSTIGDSKSKHVVEIEAQYTGLVVRPGDKLVIAFSGRVTEQMMHMVQERMQIKLPGVEIVAIDQAVGMAVYRDEEGKVAWS